ncbi:hypothetical protein L2E82_45545 [Cichorium intybus]|uniref:Uncharacterized protein n=1 Tax=Cichorium intybus TaxID=13427 RepID=A0ACB8ZSD6_CICIN|nr:hypothetical protein L2E82_45545 [Cichorium intybus]
MDSETQDHHASDHESPFSPSPNAPDPPASTSPFSQSPTTDRNPPIGPDQHESPIDNVSSNLQNDIETTIRQWKHWEDSIAKENFDASKGMMGVPKEEVDQILESSKTDMRIAGFDEEEKRMRQRI